MQLLIRADASPQIGTGHIMRCLALAQAWNHQGGRVIFATHNISPGLQSRLTNEGMKVINARVTAGSREDAEKTAIFSQQIQAEWVVIDGSHFNDQYQKVIKDLGVNLLCIDDQGEANYYYADWVLNQNIYADEKLYHNRKSYTKLLLGSQYVLLRKEFWQWQGIRRETTTIAHKILVTLGGADAGNVTAKVVEALLQIKMVDLECVIVLGANNPHYGQLQAMLNTSGKGWRLLVNIDNMPEFMAWADVAITAAGMTAWELAFMGLPSLMLVLAPNQGAIARHLGEAEMTVNLGWHEQVTVESIRSQCEALLGNFEQRQNMSRLLQSHVDGQGVWRAIEKMQLAVSESYQSY